MKKVISILLILTGLGIMLYPSATDYLHAQKQNSLIEEWEAMETPENTVEERPTQNETQAQSNYIDLEDVFNPSQETAEAAGTEGSVSTAATTDDTDSDPEAASSMKETMLGIISINKIDVELPILRGATQYNLKFGAGHLNGTAMPGNKGNSAIAAHRSREYGKNFNRLGELAAGDEITVRTREGTFTYKVTGTEIVKPTNLSVLENTKDQELTLITCDPVENPINRLIIKAELK